MSVTQNTSLIFAHNGSDMPSNGTLSVNYEFFCRTKNMEHFTQRIDVMNKLNLLFMSSSYGAGLTFNFSRLAIALKRMGHKLIVISEPKRARKGTI